MIIYQPTVSGSLQVTGSVVATQGFTGSLFGTSSLATTASYVLNAVSSSFALTASLAPSYVLTSATSSMLATKQDTLVSGTNIKTLEGLSVLGSSSLEYYNNLAFEQNFAYMIPNVGATTYTTLRSISSLAQTGQTADFNNPSRMLYASATATASFAIQRGTAGGNFSALASTLKMYWKRRFQIDCSISSSRFVCGLSNSFQLSAPTNVEPDTLINTIGVCKLSTSNNLSIFYNDATGVATTVDLGVNYPANNATAYTYDLEIYKESGTADITVELTRIDISGSRISSSQVVSTNYPTATSVSAVIYGTNNTTGSAYRFFDFGTIYKHYNPLWDTI